LYFTLNADSWQEETKYDITRPMSRGLFSETIEFLDKKRTEKPYSRGAVKLRHPLTWEEVDIIEVIPKDPRQTGGSRGNFLMVRNNRFVPLDLSVIL
jgi:hypothetical protein